MRWAVMSLTSLWRTVGNPPNGQLSACSTVKHFSQTRCDGRRGGLQLYHKQSTSRNAPLWRANPCSVIGSAVNHVEAPSSYAISTAFSSELGRVVFKLLALLVLIWWLSQRAARFASNCYSCASAGSSLDCSMMCFTRGAVTLWEVWCWDPACFTGLTLPTNCCPKMLLAFLGDRHSWALKDIFGQGESLVFHN